MAKYRADALLIAVLYCGVIIVTNPLGDFPLNDDWAFGRTVQHMIEQGDFRPTGWQAMPLLTNVLWGSFFCMPFGFSFFALRLSTLTLSLMGVLATYFLMRELRQSRWLAVLASLTVAFTPVYYALSHTFMTDVPYTSITTLAALFFVRTLRTGSPFAFVAGTVLALAATLSRQLGIAVPVAFAVAFILKNGVTKRNMFRAALPPALCVGALLVFQRCLAATGRLPGLYVAENHKFLSALVTRKTILLFAGHAYVASLYLGLFLVPVLLFVIGGIFGSHKKQIMLLFFFSTAVVVTVGMAIATFYEKRASRPFSESDIADLPEFAKRLRTHLDGVSAFLWQRLSDSDRATLMAYQSSDVRSTDVRNVAVQVLNRALTAEGIYERERFQGVTLRAETLDIMRQGPPASKLTRLNRLLLEDAYPVDLVRKTNMRLRMPNVGNGNIIVESGIGPLTLRDAYAFQLNTIPAIPGLWPVVTGISMLGAALLFTALALSATTLAANFRSGSVDCDYAAGVFLLVSVMIYLFPLLVIGFFDRYLVPTMPFLCAGIATVLLRAQRTISKACLLLAVALLCAFACYAICGTRDYLAWNRVRWTALKDLMDNQHVKPEDIDGGFEFDGWYLYDPNYRNDPKKGEWWVQGDTYRIGFGSMPGYSIIKEYNYRRWLPPHVGTIAVLKENVSGAANPRDERAK